MPLATYLTVNYNRLYETINNIVTPREGHHKDIHKTIEKIDKRRLYL